MLYEFKKNININKAAKNIQSVYGIDEVTVRMCRGWFEKFRRSDFTLKDDPRTGWPSEIEECMMKAK